LNDHLVGFEDEFELLFLPRGLLVELGAEALGALALAFGFAVEGEGPAFLKQPASRAARLFVEPDRKVECNDDVGKVDAGARIGLISAHPIANAKAAHAHVEQQLIVVIGFPPCRKRRSHRGQQGSGGDGQGDYSPAQSGKKRLHGRCRSG